MLSGVGIVPKGSSSYHGAAVIFSTHGVTGLNQQTQSTSITTTSRKRGVYLLTKLLTTGCMASGFLAIISAINGDFGHAGAAIFLAMLFDGLDGRVARWTKTESLFGKEYDSLADMVSFGVAPALVAYQWGVVRIAEYSGAWERFGWIAAFFYCVCTGLRLARFNARPPSSDKRYFEGLPSPSAAGLVSAFVWFSSEWREPALGGLVLTFSLTVICGLLMVSSFPYPSFKQLGWDLRVKFFYFIIVPIIWAFIATNPASTLLFLLSTFALSAPILWLSRKLRRLMGRPSSD